MPLEIYKRRHSNECLADVLKRIGDGTLTIPRTMTQFTFLQQYAHCKCAWWIRGTNDHGKPIRTHSLKVYSKAAAEDALAKLNKPDSPSKLRVGIEGAVEDWLNQIELGENNADRTLVAYRGIIAKLTEFCKDRKLVNLTDLTVEQINALRKKWMDEGYAKTTRTNFIRVINVFFNWAVLQEKLAANPLHKIKGVHAKGGAKGMTLPLDPKGGDEVYRKFLDACHPFLAAGMRRARRGSLAQLPDNFVALVELMYETGLRISDAIAFQPDRMVINDRCGVYTTRMMKARKTEPDGTVTVYVPLALALRIKALPKISGPYAFLDTRYESIHSYIRSEVNRRMREIGDSCGLTGIRPHRFRDSFAVNRLNEGWSYDEVALALGHKDPKMTREYYSPFVESRSNYLMNRRFPQQPKVVEINKKKRAS